tara:strand:+ start:13490 stop:13648 length:159 start_codon:yes stop_codon:yes gene_type:complete
LSPFEEKGDLLNWKFNVDLVEIKLAEKLQIRYAPVSPENSKSPLKKGAQGDF